MSDGFNEMTAEMFKLAENSQKSAKTIFDLFQKSQYVA